MNSVVYVIVTVAVHFYVHDQAGVNNFLTNTVTMIENILPSINFKYAPGKQIRENYTPLNPIFI